MGTKCLRSRLTLPQLRRAKVWQSSNLAVVAATETVVGFDTEVFDKWAMHDNATNNSRLTPPAYAHPNLKGLWWVRAQARWAGGATGYRCIRIRDAGNLVAESRIVPVNGSETWHECSAIVDRPTYLEMYVEHTQGANLNTLGGAQDTLFQAVRVV